VTAAPPLSVTRPLTDAVVWAWAYWAAARVASSRKSGIVVGRTKHFTLGACLSLEPALRAAPEEIPRESTIETCEGGLPRLVTLIRGGLEYNVPAFEAAQRA
jgi:hypothetical protein